MKCNHLYIIVSLALIQFTTVFAQTVQLPAVRQFSAHGGVVVPDGGSVYLGGNRSSSTTSSSRGIPGVGRLPGGIYHSSQSSSGGVSVHATIIDLNEIDRQILGYDPREARRARQNETTVVTAAAEIAEAKSLVRNARRAISEGKRSLAKPTYALAIEKLGRYDEAAELLVYAQAEYARVFGEGPGARNRSRTAPSARGDQGDSRRAEPSVDNVGRRLRPSELDPRLDSHDGRSRRSTIVARRLRPSELDGSVRSRREQP